MARPRKQYRTCSLVTFAPVTSTSNGSAPASTCGRTPWRARQWAEERFGADAAMVIVRVDLDGCLDLLNPRWQAELHDADFEFVLERFIEGRPIPVNTDTGNHARDAATINFYCDRASGEGRSVGSVRAIFEEGEPIFEASKIRSKSHVQIAVRDLTAIVEIEEVA